ncbi:hypothetical protein Syun_006244 [Stephania yunnanensis]|uniref:RRM domain-containing protein n=1 Tax=Stephania yunnanensis TaxID=152371 RepID=A0AAP0KXN8_9MAGN
MAFSGRFGSLMRQIASQNVVLKGQMLAPSMLNAVRCMSSTKLFIGGLSYGTDDQSLRDAFASFGDVNEVLKILFDLYLMGLIGAARVITDRDTGRSRGFGFVDFATQDCASSAMQSMDGQELHGRNIRVSYANDRPPRSNYGGGGGYQGGGGYGGSGGRDEGY